MHAASARKAEDILCLDLSRLCSYCDYFIICNGTNRRHVAAIAQGIADDLKELGLRPIGLEGMEAQRWVLADFGDVIVHIFDPAMRGFYDLESLWSDAKKIPAPPEKPVVRIAAPAPAPAPMPAPAPESEPTASA